MLRDKRGFLQLYTVNALASNPEQEMACISCKPKEAIGMEAALIPRLNKGASDWHPSG
jgi:hypothetical protein